MKKLILILFATILLNLAFTSCDDEFGILHLRFATAYVLIPEEFNITEPFKEKADNDYSYFSEFAGYDDSNFKRMLNKNYDNYNVYYGDSRDVHLETRRNFKENIEFEIIGHVNGNETSEIVNFDIEIPYLKTGNNCCEFQIQTENFGIINLLYRYYFVRYI